MAKQKEEQFVSKEFSLLVPFQIKEMGTGMMSGEGDESGESMTIEGYANWYGDDVGEDGDGVACDLAGEAVVPSGIDLSVFKGNPQILWQHNRQYTCGKANKTVRKKEGLFVNATIYKGAMEEEDWFRVKNGLITRFSIGFRTLAGEYKEVSGKNIFFITKSLLMEISLVTIPCSSESSFSVIKSLEDGSFLSCQKETPPTPTEEVKQIHTITEDTTMKLALKDLLTEAEVSHLSSLGLAAALEAEQEVSTKAYIDQAVKAAVLAATAELQQEIDTLKSLVPAPAEEEAEVETETEVDAEGTKEEEAQEEKEDDTESDVDATVEFKSVQDELDKLKTLLNDEK